MTKDSKNITTIQELADAMFKGFERLEGKIESEVEGLARMVKNSFDESDAKFNKKIEIEVESLARITKNGFNNTEKQIDEIKNLISVLENRTMKLEKKVFAVK